MTKIQEFIDWFAKNDEYNKFVKESNWWEMHEISDEIIKNLEPTKEINLMSSGYNDDMLLFKDDNFFLVHYSYYNDKKPDYRIIATYYTPAEFYEKEIKPDIERYFD